MAIRPVRVISVCAGGGGLDAGLKLALPQARTVVYVENEVSEAGVLVKGIASEWLDDAPIWSDLKTFDPEPWRGNVDCLIGGYPCQPFSTSGRRRGSADPRHLWPYIEALIARLKPAVCFFENVEGHLKLGYFDIVRPSLESMGYRVTEGLFTAAEVGATHVRRRLFILAIAKSGWGSREPREQESSRLRRHRSAIASPALVLGDTDNTRRRRRLQPREGGDKIPPWPPGPAESPETWARYVESGGPLPAVRRGVNGMAYRRLRLHVLGNGVVPVVAAKAFLYLARGFFK